MAPPAHLRRGVAATHSMAFVARTPIDTNFRGLIGWLTVC
jgi:hypothetical protein